MKFGIPRHRPGTRLIKNQVVEVSYEWISRRRSSNETEASFHAIDA